jgi:HlyD family secretion protein
MRNQAVGAVLKDVRTLLDVGTSTGLSDGQLLERYLLRRDDAAEVAFRVLVERHGPMVLRTCRGVLHDVHAAEDAFQATFLILARKARSIRQMDSVASWLFGVARRVALRADDQRKRRAIHERQGVAMEEASAGSSSSDDRAEPVLEVQEEVDRLPERYRAPIVLCYFEGLTQEEAASRLRLPASTVRVRLMRARSRLRDRLIGRGLAPAGLAGLSAGRADTAMPVPLVEDTVKAAVRSAVGRAAGASAPVAALVEGVIRAMFLAKLKTAAALLAALTIASLAMISTFAGPAPSGQDPPAVADKPKLQAKGDDLGPEVIVVTAKRSRWERTMNLAATLVSYGSVDVYAGTSGYLKDGPVDIGSRVKKGALLAQIYDPEVTVAVDKAHGEVTRAHARVAKALAATEVAQAALDVEHAKVQAAAAALDESETKAQPYKKQLDRTRELAKNAPVAEHAVDEIADRYVSALAGSKTARSQLEVAKAAEVEARMKVRAARADVDEAKSELHIAEAGMNGATLIEQYTRITAPFDGVVTRRNYHEGAFVRSANMGNAEPIVTIVRSDKMLVVVRVPENFVPYLDEGDPANISIDALGRREVFQGQITRTAYALDPQDRTLRAEIALPNTDGRLRPGLGGQAWIVLESRENAISLPISAIRQQRDDTAQCFRVVDGRVVRTRITLGPRDFRRAVVLDGLKEGDVVIADPDNQIADGQAVTIRQDGDAQ